MKEEYIGFALWVLCALFILGIGIVSFFSKKQVGFWANVEAPKIQDVKGYNRAVGILWCVYAVVMIVFGLPLLEPQTSALILIPILGVVMETIVIMIVYMKIEQKYKKK